MIRETSIQGLLNAKKYKVTRVDEFKGVFGIKEREPADVVKYEETTFRYDIYGPYGIPMKNPNKVKERTFDAEGIKGMWDDLREGKKQEYPIADACGVYVVGMRNGENTTPWYVGTTDYRSFEKKCFNSDTEKLEKVINSKKGAPVIYLLPRLTEKKGKFEPSKPMKNKPGDMDYVKRVLLDYGVQANEEILFEDSPDTEILRDLYVQGLVKSKAGKPPIAVRELKSLLGLL